MNREIKFRIWDIENKEMLKVQELDNEVEKQLEEGE